MSNKSNDISSGNTITLTYINNMSKIDNTYYNETCKTMYKQKKKYLSQDNSYMDPNLNDSVSHLNTN